MKIFSKQNNQQSQNLITLKQWAEMARLKGFEPLTVRLEGGCSIQLSYRRKTHYVFRGGLL